MTQLLLIYSHLYMRVTLMSVISLVIYAMHPHNYVILYYIDLFK